MTIKDAIKLLRDSGHSCHIIGRDCGHMGACYGSQEFWAVVFGMRSAAVLTMKGGRS